MGMFDYVKCEYPLPDPEAQGLVFQTKDTDAQNLETYLITADGRLLHEPWRYVPVTPVSSKPVPAVAAGSSLAIGVPDTKSATQAQFSGPITFYMDGPDGTWFEYCAMFIDGRLQGLWPLRGPSARKDGAP